MAQIKKVYFPGMNGIRFIAAFSVIFHHIEQSKFWMNVPSVWNNIIVDNIGHKGRIIFFVLSGFLITYLFLAEIKKTGTLDTKKFHIRRNLRVWPLYIVIVLFSLLILPYFNHLTCHHCSHGYGPTPFNDIVEVSYWKKFILYLFMFANFARFMWPPVPGLSQLWSIGVQEQFYLLWPSMTKWFKRYFLPMVLFVIIGKEFGEAAIRFIKANWDMLSIPFISQKQFGTVLSFWEIFAVEQIALGALAAYIFIEEKSKILNFVYNKYVIAIVVFLFFGSFFVEVDFYFHGFFEGIVSTFLLLNISTNPKFPVKLEHPWMNHLGNISYGIYLFHNIFIILVMNVLFYYGLETNLWAFNIIIYVAVIALTLFFSHLSFNYFERYFLKLKGKFEVIKSSRKIAWNKEKN